jgi:hypothetical protein
MYKPGFPEMDNIFLNSFLFYFIKNSIWIVFYFDPKLYRGAFIPFYQKKFDTLEMFFLR